MSFASPNPIIATVITTHEDAFKKRLIPVTPAMQRFQNHCFQRCIYLSRDVSISNDDYRIVNKCICNDYSNNFEALVTARNCLHWFVIRPKE